VSERVISVLGLGYVGLPTASMLATRGYRVYGVDIDERVVAELSKGRTQIREPELDTLVLAAVQSGNLRCGTKAQPADVFIVAVPTPIKSDRSADLDAVAAATRSVAAVLRPGNLVILESTVPPGTTTGLMCRILETSELKAGRDFKLAHCPERVLPGKLLVELVSNDRIIGGFDGPSAAAAAEVYRSFVTGELVVTDATTAELVKLMENTHRDVNIALANEFALIAERLQVDVWQAIRLASRHPRVQFLQPGPGVGGHCIAVDPWFVVQAAPDLARLIKTARDVNDAMPSHVVDVVRSTVGRLDQAKVVILGLTYKADVTDTRGSPSAMIVEALRDAGADVREHDAMVRADIAVSELAAAADAIVLLVDHHAYRELRPAAVGAKMRTRALVDTRGVIDPEPWRKSGFTVRTLGRGDAYRAPA
jgi:UDP-N-acetyl-D-mannosaminuronic acid dehydrogenase